MKIFVAGATGVLGRRVVPLLVAAGHDVRAPARSAEKSALLRTLGARAVDLDLFDAGPVHRAVAGSDVVCNLATHIPATTRMAMPGAWAQNDRIRTEASRNLVDGARAAGAGRFVQESITFLYCDAADRWIDETSPIQPAANLASATVAEAHAARFSSGGAIGVVLRFAAFYGPDSGTTLDMIKLAKRRIALGAAPDAYTSSITTDDAARAVVASLSAPAGLYNVGDDEPLPRREFFSSLAGALGVRPPRIAPAGLARLGGSKASVLTRSQRVSNRTFVDATGWAPVHRSVREGWPFVVTTIATSNA
ncbi:MAG TPA: NAD(P)H-binding protein [Acidimicrobiales bacterium]|nr:NAD(P)H-binding protein [Acidimicrobiales bacterium]